MKKLYSLALSVLLFCSLASAQNWNLVWREDFGVAEDTVVKDFPDPTMKVEGHTFAGECSSINDGYYGIANSTLWAVKRWKKCNVNNNWFHSGRDHTGNDKGCMLIVNVGSQGKGEEIYAQDINFKLCSERRYKFTVFAASVTGFTVEALANLTLQIYNRANNQIIGQVLTGDIPQWDGQDVNGAWIDDATTPFAERQWYEFSIEFTASDGDEISLKVLNHSPSGSGNDFVIDDISLYRDDQYGIPISSISTNTISSESVLIAGKCTFSASFTVPSDVVEAWNKVYLHPYYVWQKSTDDGLTWTTMTEYCGEGMSNIVLDDIDENANEVYRVVTSGDISVAGAKTQTEYIAEHGGPADGDACAYYSISNILAGVSPTIDCSYKDGLKTIWREDFGVVGEGEIKASPDVATLHLFQGKIVPPIKNNGNDDYGHKFGNNASSYPEYGIASDPSKAFEYCYHNSWESSPWHCGNSSDLPKLSDASGKANGGFLYAAYQSQNGKCLYQKTINVPFCNCKNYQFSFSYLNPESWSTLRLTAVIYDKNGSILASQEAVSSGKDGGHKEWERTTIPFSLPNNYVGSLTIKLIANDNDWHRIGLDDFKLSICSEKAPQAAIMIDNVHGQVYKGGFDCGSEVHYVNVEDAAEWYAAYPNYGKAWQKSTDGGSTWTYVSSGANVLYDGETQSFVEYRAVFAETQALADAIAKNTNTDGCSVFGYSNTVGFSCVEQQCNKPAKPTISSSDADNILCEGETATLTPASQADATLFSYTWYKGSIADANVIAGPTVSASLEKVVSETGTYIVVAADKDASNICKDSSKVEIVVKERPTLKEITVTGKDEYCDGETVSPAVFTFEGEGPFTFTYSDGTKTFVDVESATASFNPPTPSELKTYTYTVSALHDKYCAATTTTGSAKIEIRPVPSAVAGNNGPVCSGSSLTLQGSSDKATAKFNWSGPNSYSATSESPVIISATSAMSGRYRLITSLNGCSDTAYTTVTVNAIPTAPTAENPTLTFCQGETTTPLSATAIAGATLNWYETETGGTASATAPTYTTTSAFAKDYYVSQTLNGCEGERSKISVTVKEQPAAPTVTDVSVCQYRTPTSLTATVESGATVNWYETATGGTGSTTKPTYKATSPFTKDYFVSQTLDGCESERAKLTVTVNAKPTPNIIGDDWTCLRKPVTLRCDKTYSEYRWSEGDTGDGRYGRNQEATFPASTGFFGMPYLTERVGLYVKDENGCETNVTHSIKVYATPTATISASPNSICNLTSTTITAVPSSTGGTATWSDNVSDPTETTAEFTATEEGTVTVSYMYTDARGCKMSSPVTTKITVNAIPEKPVVTDVEYCMNDIPTELTATADGTLQWYDADKALLASAPTPNTSEAGTIVYFVTQSANGCESDFAQINVTIHPLPTPTISASKDAACMGNAITLNIDKQYNSLTWTCTPTNVLNSTTLASPTIQASAAPDTYDICVEVTDAKGCKAKAQTKQITIHPIPSVELSTLSAECESNTTAQTITATIAPNVAGEGQWGNPAVKATETTATFIPSVAKHGSYTITYDFTSDDGCVAQQATTSVEVFALPEITLLPSKASVCRGGNNSDDVTMKTTGTVATGGFAYSSVTLAGLNPTTGAFSPATENAGTHTVKLIYTDENSCQDEAETTVTINARPVADVSMNQTSVCDYDAAFSLTAEIDGTATTTGTFAGTGVSANSFSPATAGAGGPYIITYNYTDAATQCSAEETSFAITVHHTNAPTTTSASDSKLNVTDQASVPTISASGTDIKWYLANDNTSTVVGTANDYQFQYINDGGYMKVGQYVAYASQTENGCQSALAEAILTITDCSVTAPNAVKYHACVAEDGTGIEVSATSTYANPDAVNNFGWFYDRTQIPSTTVASLAAANPDGTGVTFVVPQSKLTTEGTVTVYVAEYDGTVGTQCFSPATAVTIEVHANPVPVIDDPGMICSETQEVTITYTPGTGATLSGTGVNGDKWTPQFNAATTGETTTTLTLDAEKTWGTGTDVTATCHASTTLDVKVTNVLAPTGTGIGTEQLWSIGSIESLPAMEIDYASSLGATFSVKDASQTEIATSSPVAMYPRISAIGTYNYTISQSLNGCQSPEVVSTYKVVECPTPTPQPESVSICAGDALPTLTANGQNNPSYEWIDSQGTLIANTEALDVSGLAGYVSETGTYTFKVRQNGLDAAGAECWGGYGTATVTINPLPVVEIAEIPTLCYDGGDFEVIATVDGVRSSNGTWQIVGETSGISSAGIISPSFKNNSADGDFTVRYEVTNASTSCSNSAERPLHVEFVELPSVVNYNGIITDPKTVQVSVADVETGAEYHWFASASATDVLAKGNMFATGDDPETVVSKNYYVSKHVDGCESKRVPASVQIVNCPWKVQQVTNAEACQNFTALSAMTATPQTGATIQAWKWVDEHNVEVSATDSYTQTSTATAGISKYYVSYQALEASSNTYCWTPAVEVTTTVFALPKITFNENASTICYTTSPESIAVDVDFGTNGEGTGTWSVTGDPSALSASGVFNPQANGETSGQYTITYEYTDGKNCTSSNSRTIDVIYLPAPETVGYYGMTTQTNPVEVKVTSTVEAEIRWLSAETIQGELSSSTAFQTGDNPAVAMEKSYFARQYKDGCYSEPTEAKVVIAPCPIPSVAIESKAACVYDDVPVLQATSGLWAERDAAKSTFNFYATETPAMPDYSSADGSFQPTLSGAGAYTFYVTESNSEPLQNLTNPAGCESKNRVPVTITLKETPAPQVQSSVFSVCHEAANPTFVATNSQGTVLWYEEDPGAAGIPTVASMKEASTYVPSHDEVGEHTVWAVQLKDGCYSKPVSQTYTIKPIPAAPTPTNNEICYGEPTKAISAAGEANVVIIWYEDKSGARELLRGNNAYLPKKTNAGTYTYYASQFVNGCESPLAEVSYKVKALPGIPNMKSQPNLCEYDAAPVLNASGDNIIWYASDKLTPVAEGNSYQVDDMSVGTHRFYATQTVEGCEGAQAFLSFNVGAKPANPIVTGASMCAGDTIVPALTTNISIDKWYSDASAATYLTAGYTYTPDLESVIGSSTYYVQREQNGCLSDVVPVVLNVIQQPTFSIGDDITRCVYDSVAVIQATDFEPAITDNSYIGWTVSGKTNSKVYFDNEEHSIQPEDMITTDGTYTVSAFYRYKYDNVSCNSETKTIAYTVKKRARTPIVFSTIICQGDEIGDLRALGSKNMTWKSLSGTSPAFCSGSRYSFDNKDLATGEYQFEVYDVDVYDAEQNLGCESLHDTVSMTVAPAAKTRLFGFDSVCVGATEQYYTQFTENSSYYWSVSGGNLNYSKDDQSSSVRYIDWMKAGIDTLIVYEQTWAGCEGLDTLIVKIAANPEARFTWDLPGTSNIIELADFSRQDSLWYTNAAGESIGEEIPYTMFWNFGHQGEDETAVDKTVAYEHRRLPFAEGDYIYGYNCPTLTVKNSFGCSDSYTECVFVDITTSLFVPNAFSPTNPAHSVRTFQPKGFNLKTCEISVYDKWGNLLWFSDAVEDGRFVGYWDGRYDGKMMKSDVYIWKMEATFLDGKVWEGFDAGNGKKTKFGSVTLVR